MPARKPTRTKELAGTLRPHRENEREPEPTPAVPKPPEDLAPGDGRCTALVADGSRRCRNRALAGGRVCGTHRGQASPALGALDVWRYYAPRLADLRVLAETDREALFAFCVAAEGVRRCREVLEEEGHFYQSKSGLRREHPAGKALRDWLLRLQSLAGELGLTPASRSRVETLPEDELEDELEKLLRETPTTNRRPPVDPAN